MKLPNRKKASIKKEKINYLISLTDPVGKLKAGFFRPIGFNEANTSQLKQEFYNIAQNNEIKSTRASADNSGINYEIRGILAAPNGKKYPITTIWFIKTGTKIPSFITAYPV